MTIADYFHCSSPGEQKINSLGEDYYKWELAAAREIYGNPWVVRGDFNATRFTEALKGKLREWNLANIGSCKERKVIS